MLGWMAFCCPLTYITLRSMAAARHRRVLGTDQDMLMRMVYPL